MRNLLAPHSGHLSLFQSTHQFLGYMHPDPPCEFAVLLVALSFCWGLLVALSFCQVLRVALSFSQVMLTALSFCWGLLVALSFCWVLLTACGCSLGN